MCCRSHEMHATLVTGRLWMGVTVSSQIGSFRASDGRALGRKAAERLTVVRESAAQRPRDRVARLLRDPKSYFADSRRWADRQAKADVQRELSEKESRRARRSLLRALWVAVR